MLAGINFLFYLNSSLVYAQVKNATTTTTSTSSTVSTTVSAVATCGSTIGSCLGFYFDQIVIYLDSLGFLDASYGLAVLLFKTTITLLSYPSMQFVCFWTFLCVCVCFFLRPFFKVLCCLVWPAKKIVLVTRKAVAPCMRGLTPAQQREYRMYLAQGDDGKESSIDTNNLSPGTDSVADPVPVEVTPSHSTSQSAPISGSTLVVNRTSLRARCENDIITTDRAGECPMPNLVSKDSTCGTLEYGLIQETAVPRVSFVDYTGPSSVDVEKCYSRMSRVSPTTPVTWTAGSAAGTIVFQQNMKDMLFENPIYKQLKARYANFRFDLRYVINLQHNTSALGSLVAMWVPTGRLQPTYTSGSPLLTNFGVFQHIWMSASEDRTSVIEVKYPSPANFRDTYTVTTAVTGDPHKGIENGRLLLIVGHPLAVPAGVPTTMNVEINVQLVNIKATYSQAPLYSTQGLIDVTTNVFRDITNSSLSSDKGGDKFDTVLGLDHPSDTRQPMSMIRRTFQKLFATRGPLDVQRMTYNQSDVLPKKVEGVDEMSVAYLMSCPNIYSVNTLSSGAVKGSKVFSIPLHPIYSTRTIQLNVNCMSNGFIYDSATVTVKIPKTTYQTGKLFLCLSQGMVDSNGLVTATPSTLTSLYDMLSLPSMIVDLNSKDFEHNFTIPWHAIMDWIPSANTCGKPGGNASYFNSSSNLTGAIVSFSLPVVSCYVLIPPSTSVNVANQVNMITSVCYSGYRGIYGQNPAITNTYAQGKNVTVDVARKFPFTKIDDFISLRQLWQQPHMFQSGSLNSTNTNYRYRFSDFVNSFECSQMYMYMMGSFRLMICFSNWACDYIVIEHYTPHLPRATQVPTDATLATTTPSFLNNALAVSANDYQPFKSTYYNASWAGNGTLYKPIFVDKNSPYIIMEIPIIRPWSCTDRDDNLGGMLTFSAAGQTATQFVQVQMFVMAGDDFKMTHISNPPVTLLLDNVTNDALSPWDY